MPAALLLLLAVQVHRGRDTVDPATFTSPSGAFELLVDPSRIDGGGPATYRMLRGGVEVWSGARDFTLLDACVGEGGHTFGYSLSEGWYGPSYSEPGDFHVVVLGPDGAVLQDERHARENSRFLHTDPDPKPRGMLLLESADACLLRVADPDLNRGLESWWVYRLSTGERLSEYLPAERLGRHEEPRWKVGHAQVLAEAGLVLTAGFGYHDAGIGSASEQWFALLEPTGGELEGLEPPPPART